MPGYNHKPPREFPRKVIPAAIEAYKRELGLTLSSIRMAMALTQDDVAGFIGCSRAQIQHIDSGRANNLEDTLAYCQALGVQPGAVMPLLVVSNRPQDSTLIQRELGAA